ncbi:hypothetical protein K502DRAFT_347378 [Neoconidiobolus thromboides FSU 785]|nr:hypothetical protein K502DRAFT_347378 [Neoconidiobolus thromboides FSU 785]
MNLTIGFRVPKGLEDISLSEINEKVGPLISSIASTNEFKIQNAIGLIMFQIYILDQEIIYLLWERIESLRLYSVEAIGLIIKTIEIDRHIYLEQSESKEDNDFSILLKQSLDDITLQDWTVYFKTLKLKDKETLFRVSVDKNNFKHPNLKSQDIAGFIGFSALSSDQINFTNLKVDLKYHQLDISADLIPTKSSEGYLTLVLGIINTKLNLNNGSYLRRNRIESGRTSIKPTIAYCLSRYAGIKPGDIVLDPCCGVGTIPIEASCSYQPQAYYLAGDIEESSIYSKACINIKYSKVKNVELIQWNSKSLPIKSNSVDKVISDLPWGMREGSRNMCSKLYPKLMKELSRIVKVGGGAFLVTLDHPLLKRCLEYDHIKVCWKIIEVKTIKIGFEVKLFCLERISST